MPLQIQNQALYADRTVQDWHRRVMSYDSDAIDVDLMGVCAVKWCRDPLYVIEATTNPDKPASILRKLAMKAGMVGIVVYHDTEEITGFKAIHDPLQLTMHLKDGVAASELLQRVLSVIRSHHLVTVHKSS